MRSVCGASSTSDIVISGSYDHTVKLWDHRSNSCIATMDHEAPVDNILCIGGVVLSGGGNEVRVWDIVTGKLLHNITNFQKAVTCMTLSDDNKYLLVGSSDQHVRIFNGGVYDFVHAISYSAPVLALALSVSFRNCCCYDQPESKVLSVGLADGVLHFRTRKTDSKPVAQLTEHKFRTGSYRYFLRGAQAQPMTGDNVPAFTKKPKFQVCN